MWKGCWIDQRDQRSMSLQLFGGDYVTIDKIYGAINPAVFWLLICASLFSIFPNVWDRCVFTCVCVICFDTCIYAPSLGIKTSAQRQYQGRRMAATKRTLSSRRSYIVLWQTSKQTLPVRRQFMGVSPLII